MDWQKRTVLSPAYSDPLHLYWCSPSSFLIFLWLFNYSVCKNPGTRQTIFQTLFHSQAFIALSLHAVVVSYFPDTRDWTLHINFKAPTKSSTSLCWWDPEGSKYLLIVPSFQRSDCAAVSHLEEVIPLPLPSTQTCPLECPSQTLPATQAPSFNKQCLLIKETKLPILEGPQAA